ESSQLSPAAKAELATHLETKREQFEEAVNLALATELAVAVDSGENRSPLPQFFRQEQTFLYAVPGQTFTVTARFYNRSRQNIVPRQIDLSWHDILSAAVVEPRRHRERLPRHRVQKRLLLAEKLRQRRAVLARVHRHRQLGRQRQIHRLFELLTLSLQVCREFCLGGRGKLRALHLLQERLHLRQPG